MYHTADHVICTPEYEISISKLRQFFEKSASFIHNFKTSLITCTENPIFIQIFRQNQKFSTPKVKIYARIFQRRIHHLQCGVYYVPDWFDI